MDSVEEPEEFSPGVQGHPEDVQSFSNDCKPRGQSPRSENEERASVHEENKLEHISSSLGESTPEQDKEDKMDDYQTIDDQITKLQSQLTEKPAKHNKEADAVMLRESIARLKAQFINLQSLRLIVQQSIRRNAQIENLREGAYDLIALSKRIRRARTLLEARLEELRKEKELAKKSAPRPAAGEEDFSLRRVEEEQSQKTTSSKAAKKHQTQQKAEAELEEDKSIAVMAQLQLKQMQQMQEEERIKQLERAEAERRNQELANQQLAKRAAEQLALEARQRIEKQRAQGQLRSYQQNEFATEIAKKTAEMQDQKQRAMLAAQQEAIARKEEKDRIRRQFMDEAREKQLRKAALLKQEQEKQEMAAAERQARRKALEQRYIAQLEAANLLGSQRNESQVVGTQQRQPALPQLTQRRTLVTLNGRAPAGHGSAFQNREPMAKAANITRARSQTTLSSNPEIRQTLEKELKRSYLQQVKIQEKAGQIQFQEHQKAEISKAQLRLSSLIKAMRELPRMPNADTQRIHSQIVTTKELLVSLRECKTDGELHAVSASFGRRLAE